MDNDTPTPRCANPACGHPFLPEQDAQKYCAARCREAAKKRRQRFRLRRGGDAAELLVPVGTGVADESLSDMAGIYDEDQDDDEQAARFHQMVQEDAGQRTPRDVWRKWRTYARRHGTEHPEQTQDRIERHRAAEAAQTARIDRSTAGRIQDRFDSRTASTVATNARESRRLNVRHVDQPPVVSPGFDFTGESFDGGPYRQGRPAGQRSTTADYRWNMQDGW